MPEPLLSKYFEQINGRFILNKELRRCGIFGRHDLLQDSPISRIDLLVCRNTLMYFHAEAQMKILQRFHFALADMGYLFVGKAEMLFSRGNLFTPVDLKRRIYMKLPSGKMRDRLLFVAQTDGQGSPTVTPENLGEHSRIREAAFDIDPDAPIVARSS